mmetsp:Transcript_37503/g.55217  ORF Transcript_37503/g.55217 Transcript_37503/m.55217 type:complete len:187 (-) Transcript_37503:123-683(-)
MSPMMVFEQDNNDGNDSIYSRLNNSDSQEQQRGINIHESPSISLNTQHLGKLFLVLGASGGPKIITSTLQTFVNYALLGMSLVDSVSQPRVHDQLLYHGKSTTLFDEAVFVAEVEVAEDVKNQQHKQQRSANLKCSNATKSALLRRGHELKSVSYTGTCQAVAVDLETDMLSAVSDIRKGGIPAGY